MEYFLKKICECSYDHNIICAPTKEILQQYKKNEMTWGEYEKQYNELIIKRKLASNFRDKYANYSKILLLCSEPTPEHCHRRLLAEYLRKELGFNIVHI